MGGACSTHVGDEKCISFPANPRIFFAASSRLDLWPTRPHNQWLPWGLFPAGAALKREAYRFLASLSWLRMRGAISLFHRKSS